MVDSFPNQCEVGSKATRYILANNYYAVFGALPDGVHDVEFRMPDDEITVCRGVPPHELTELMGKQVCAVYRVGQSGPLAVPTGQVFVRFEDNTLLRDRAEEIASAGFTIRQVLSYAPQAGWVHPTSGYVQDALQGYSRLEQIAGVHAVEPQMLTPPSHR
jgi:hypothetical protein